MAEGLPRDLRLKAGSSSRAVDRGLGYSGTRLTLQLSFASCPKPPVASIRRFANCRESMSGWLDRVWRTARARPANLERSGPRHIFPAFTLVIRGDWGEAVGCG